MPLRYYPSARVIPNQKTTGGDFILNGQSFVGQYYLTYDGSAYSGPDPLTGPGEKLTPKTQILNSPALLNLASSNTPQSVINAISSTNSSTKTINPTQTSNANANGPVPYYPYILDSDYIRGYIIRYFAKKINNKGYVIEISPEEYSSINNGTTPYDLTLWQTASIFWKLTGPLNTIRISQFDSRAGIIDINKRLTETLDITFLGIKDFINGKYDKYARPTT